MGGYKQNDKDILKKIQACSIILTSVKRNHHC